MWAREGWPPSAEEGTWEGRTVTAVDGRWAKTRTAIGGLFPLLCLRCLRNLEIRRVVHKRHVPQGVPGPCRVANEQWQGPVGLRHAANGP